jgi:hypothetical protein
LQPPQGPGAHRYLSPSCVAQYCAAEAGLRGEAEHPPTSIVGVIQRDEAAIAFGSADDTVGNPYGLAPGTEYHVMVVALEPA